MRYLVTIYYFKVALLSVLRLCLVRRKTKETTPDGGLVCFRYQQDFQSILVKSRNRRVSQHATEESDEQADGYEGLEQSLRRACRGRAESDCLYGGRPGCHRIPQDGRYKYLGGAISLDKKALYLFPCDAERVLKIHTETNELIMLVGPLLLDGENKYQNGFVARDGCVYAIPQRAIGILRIDPNDNDHVNVMAC